MTSALSHTFDFPYHKADYWLRMLFLLCLGCVLRLFPWQALLLILLAVLLPFNRRLLYKADYGLLFTFLFFFLFILFAYHIKKKLAFFLFFQCYINRRKIR